MDTKTVVKRKRNIPHILLVTILAFILVIALGFGFRYFYKRAHTMPSASELDTLWSTQDYQSVYDLSLTILEEHPFHSAALAYKGYASFYLAIAYTNPLESQKFIEISINALRLSLQYSNKEIIPQVEYLLGKAYYHKNSICAYSYYADLAVFYLNKSLENDYFAEDTYEYLGLSYAALDEKEKSIASFTEALQYNSSDVLLMAIATQYYKNAQNVAAKPYLYRIKKTSTDDVLVLECNNLLGKIYTEEKNYKNAQQEFNEILAKNPNFADAHYGLGVIYELQGDIVKARSEWRKTLALQINHAGALQKMGKINN